MKQPNKILNLGKREKIQQANTTILVVVGVASVVVSIAIVFGNFLFQQKSYNDRVYNEKAIARDTLESNITNVSQLEEQYQTLESSSSIAKPSEILDALPGDYDNPALRTSIESLVKKNSLSLDTITAEDAEGEVEEVSVTPTPQEIPLSVTVIGNYNRIRSFIQDLEVSIRPMKVETILLSGSNDEMRADISVVTYFQPTQEIGTTTKEVQ